MKPTGEREALLQLDRMLSQREEHTLRHILGEVCITENPLSCRVNEVDMAMHQLAERGFATGADVCANQNLVAVVFHSQMIHRRSQNRTLLQVARAKVA